jgi:hypothetical protein
MRREVRQDGVEPVLYAYFLWRLRLSDSFCGLRYVDFENNGTASPLGRINGAVVSPVRKNQEYQRMQVKYAYA